MDARQSPNTSRSTGSPEAGPDLKHESLTNSSVDRRDFIKGIGALFAAATAGGSEVVAQAPNAREVEVKRWSVKRDGAWTAKEVYNDNGEATSSFKLVAGAHLSRGDALQAILDLKEELRKKNEWQSIPKEYNVYLVTYINGRESDKVQLPRDGLEMKVSSASNVEIWTSDPHGADAIDALRIACFQYRGGKVGKNQYVFEPTFGYNTATKNPSPLFAPNGALRPNVAPNSFGVELRKKGKFD